MSTLPPLPPARKSRNAPIERSEFNDLKKTVERLQKMQKPKVPRKLSDYNKFMSTEMASIKKKNPEWSHDKIFAESVSKWNVNKGEKE
jgi:hypothetical protein